MTKIDVLGISNQPYIPISHPAGGFHENPFPRPRVQTLVGIPAAQLRGPLWKVVTMKEQDLETKWTSGGHGQSIGLPSTSGDVVKAAH